MRISHENISNAVTDRVEAPDESYPAYCLWATKSVRSCPPTNSMARSLVARRMRLHGLRKITRFTPKGECGVHLCAQLSLFLPVECAG